MRKNFPNTVLCFSHKLVFDLVPRKELKKDLPSQFVKAFLKRHGFHSWTYFVNFGSGDATSCFFKFQVLACQVQFNMMLHHLQMPANYGGVFGMGTICVRSSTVLAALQCIVFWPLLVGADVGIEGTIVQHSCFCCHGKWLSGRIRTFEMPHKFRPKRLKKCVAGAETNAQRGRNLGVG